MKTWDGVFMHTPIPLLYEMLFNQIEALCQHPYFLFTPGFYEIRSRKEDLKMQHEGKNRDKVKTQSQKQNTSQMWMVEGKVEEMPTERSCKDIERGNVRM